MTTTRPPHVIIEDWRAAEAALDLDKSNAELAARIAALREEYAAAVADRDDLADDLGKRPSASATRRRN